MQRDRRNKVLSFCNFALVVTFLVVVLTSQQGQGCQCPSCHYSSATQNCQCCVFRQLGKRADPDPALTPDKTAAMMTPDLPSSLSRYLSRPISDEDNNDVASRRARASEEDQERALFSDWLLPTKRRHPSFYYYGLTSGNDDDVIKPRMRGGEGLNGYIHHYPRVNPKLSFLQSRLLESMNLNTAAASALSDSDSEDMYTYQ